MKEQTEALLKVAIHAAREYLIPRKTKTAEEVLEKINAFIDAAQKEEYDKQDVRDMNVMSLPDELAATPYPEDKLLGRIAEHLILDHGVRLMAMYTLGGIPMGGPIRFYEPKTGLPYEMNITAIDPNDERLPTAEELKNALEDAEQLRNKILGRRGRE